MNNSVLLKTKQVSYNNKQLSPINRVNMKRLKEYILNNLNQFYTAEVQNDIRFEVLAYRVYQDSSLWDILMLLNYSEDGVFGFAKNSDWVNDTIENRFNKMNTYFLPYINKQEMVNMVSDKVETENETKRTVLFIKEEYVPKFREDLKSMLYVF